mmetsp:Transcript_38857/g.84594  ORF Transcript_38857/g.84594 Transcript_38857/m.84594 type:complete len:302 (+) Transcript_38857:439-1344(+)
MDELIYNVGQLEVHDVAYTWDVESAGGDISSNHNLGRAITELLQGPAPEGLGHAAVASHDASEFLLEEIVHLRDRLPFSAEDDDTGLRKLAAGEDRVKQLKFIVLDTVRLPIRKEDLALLQHFVLDEVSIGEHHTPLPAHRKLEDAPSALARDHIAARLELSHHAVRWACINDDMPDCLGHGVCLPPSAVHPDALTAEECLRKFPHRGWDSGRPEGGLAAPGNCGHAPLLHDLLELSAKAQLHHPVHLVKHQVLHIGEAADTPMKHVYEAARCRHKDVRTMCEVPELGTHVVVAKKGRATE